MSEPVHGHEVIRMMIESGAVYTKESLRSSIVEKYGEGVRFCTCSAEDLSPDELIAFLDSVGKLTPAEGGFRMAEGDTCG